MDVIDLFLPKVDPIVDIGNNPNQRFVIMAAGNDKKWGNYMNIPKQLAPVNGEPVIKRTIRQLKEHGVTDIWVTMKSPNQYGDLGVNEYIPQDNKVEIDRIYSARELIPAIYLYGDCYYSDKAINIILSDNHEFWFFGRHWQGRIKGNQEIYAIKANDWVIQKAANLRDLYLNGKIRQILGQTLHWYCEGEWFNEKAKRFVHSKPNAAKNWKYYTEIHDETEDFDTPIQYNKFIKEIQFLRKPIPTEDLTCGIIIRCHYLEDDPRFDWRYSYFKSMVLPKLQAQTDSNFDICVRCNPVHDKLFEDIGCIPFHVKEEKVWYEISQKRKKKFFRDFVTWDETIGLKQYDIQVGLDSDDLVRKDFIAKIKELCAESKTSLHIHFQPLWFVAETLQIKRHWVDYRNLNKGSMVFALYYPDKSKYRHCFERCHTELPQLAERSILIPEGYCWMTIHGQNESTGQKFNSNELRDLENPRLYSKNPLVRDDSEKLVCQ